MDENLRAVWAQTPLGRLCDIRLEDGTVDQEWVALVLSELTSRTLWVAGRRTWDLLNQDLVIAEQLRTRPGVLLSRTRLRTPATTLLLHDDATLPQALKGQQALLLGGVQLLRQHSGEYVKVRRLISGTLPATEVNAPALRGHYLLASSRQSKSGVVEEWKPPKATSIPGYDLEAPAVKFVTPEEKKKRK